MIWFSFFFFFFFNNSISSSICKLSIRSEIYNNYCTFKTQIRFPLFLLFKDLRMQQNVLKKITVRYLWISSTIVKHFSVTSIWHFLPAKISFHKLENLLHELGIFALWEKYIFILPVVQAQQNLKMTKQHAQNCPKKFDLA